jgi:hypothetical protein
MIAVGGQTVATMKLRVDADLAAAEGTPTRIASNLGANDLISGIPAEATWKTNYQYIIDAFHTKWADAKIYLAKPWVRNYDANALTMAGWIDDLVTANSGVVFVGHNENIWMKSDDNGAAMTSEGIHYSTAGNAEIINQWITAFGF